MKNSILVIFISMASIFCGCQKEELPLTKDNTVSNENGTSLLAIAGPKTVKKILKPNQSTLGVDLEGRTLHTSLAFDDKMWILAGSIFDNQATNDVLYSDNGFNWQPATDQAPFPDRRSHASTVFNNKMWIVGGRTWDHEGGTANTPLNDVWSSSDGIVWEEVVSNAPFSPRSGHTLTVFDGSMWLIREDVWRSSDGENWVLVTDNAPFNIRIEHVAVVHDEKLWVVGGLKGDPFVMSNDVWYSSDGYEWTQATNDAEFSPRSEHSLISDGNWMWLMGGAFLKNDIWFSSNGQSWAKASTCWSITERWGHSSLFINDQLFIINGRSDNGLLSDIRSFEQVPYCIAKLKNPPIPPVLQD